MFMTRFDHNDRNNKSAAVLNVTERLVRIAINIFNVFESMPLTPKKKPPIIGQAKELMIGEIVIRIEVIVPKDASFFSGLT